MRSLNVSIEIEGARIPVGHITGENSNDAVFTYDERYLKEGGKPISISLPVQSESFGARQTRNYFEGLLPEGFSRRAVASWMNAAEEDYMTILAKLGNECLGALRIAEHDDENNFSDYSILTTENVKALASEGATKSTEILMESHLSLAGASGKVGLYYDEKNDTWYQPKGNAPSTHIVKQSHVRFNKLVLNEQLCMLTAKKLGIDVPDSFIINVGQGIDEDVLFAIKRYDRVESTERIIDGLNAPIRLHQEDFAQAMGIASSDKYENNYSGYMKRMFKCVRDNCSNPIEDQLKLWDRIVFNYFIGNTDGHIKNFSLLYDANLNGMRLAPAYDIVSTRVYGLAKDMSFAVGDCYSIDEITRDSFKIAAKDVGLGEKMVLERYDIIKEKIDTCLKEAAEELADLGFDGVTEIKNKILETMK